MTQGGILTTFKNTWWEGLERQNQAPQCCQAKGYEAVGTNWNIKNSLWTDFFNIRMIEHWASGLQRGCKIYMLGNMQNSTEQPVLADPGPPGVGQRDQHKPLAHSAILWHSHSEQHFRLLQGLYKIHSAPNSIFKGVLWCGRYIHTQRFQSTVHTEQKEFFHVQLGV